MEEKKSTCAQCAKIQKTCCQEDVTFVALTGGDIERISTYTGREDFYELQAVAEELIDIYANPARFSEDDRIYVTCLFDSKGRRNILKKNKNNECCFITDTGCLLPHDIRPLICRIYPYEWNDRREVWIEAGYCPKELFKDNEDLIRKVGLSEEEVKRLVNQFYDEIMSGQGAL